ncbi:MAG: prepilin-type N-terminal cleavage/methylation domain-containing protein [Gemmatimonadetes bacterium]|nr:prepilin-type N-terminal cleavage/methylation domain-containing protein [Gemmatimonadota bacterium]
MHHRLAFSLVELLTALVLLSVGLAAFTRAAGGVARLENDARLQRALADVVQARLDSLTSAPCAPSRAGEAHHGGVTERWRAVGDGRRWLLTDSISVPARPTLARTYVAAVTCWR